jgi:hypothetical protein
LRRRVCRTFTSAAAATAAARCVQISYYDKQLTRATFDRAQVGSVLSVLSATKPVAEHSTHGRAYLRTYVLPRTNNPALHGRRAESIEFTRTLRIGCVCCKSRQRCATLLGSVRSNATQIVAMLRTKLYCKIQGGLITTQQSFRHLDAEKSGCSPVPLYCPTVLYCTVPPSSVSPVLDYPLCRATTAVPNC